MRTLYRGGRVLTPADPFATALLVDGDRIGWLGPDQDAPAGADRVIDLGGALVTPAFVDAHVHTTATGLTLQGLSLGGTTSATDVLDAVAAHARGLAPDAVVIGHGWDESGWADQTTPTAQELDRAGGGRAVYLSRTCVHAALVSSKLLTEEARQAAGYDAGGWLRRDAHHVVREAAFSSITMDQVRAAQRAALRRAAQLGIASVHECGGPGTSGEDDFVAAMSHGPALPEVYGLWGEAGAAAKAKELGARGAAGDLYADGALGARTAHLRHPYEDGEQGHGHGYLTAEQVTEHLVGCARHGVQGGFHAIGDQAIATVLRGFAGAAQRVGVDRLRAGRHRIEHVELLDKQLIAQLVDFGVVASVQPAFDRLWGGDRGMYAQRLGVERSLASNPIGSLAGVGVMLAFGSDSPVTDLDPWGSCRAALRHHNPVQRIGARAAFAAHTRGGWRAVGIDDEGVLNPGWSATFAIWDTSGDLPAVLAADDTPAARATVLRGQEIHTQ
ncbi:amidohydrolase family protein [Dactylosporangium sp. AC04546]|uniref:amidohydrolase n=1 Tax=Dactylosporangium sp. AC04546 TaxID=2862460 RepID=UPI001EDDE3B1|nr:amidohydrolase family protein [Dactylosporangium sp. AC04546]WVK89377.1 amidohydrolase family protein [Dactylosporangium sp. AC04546]